MFTPKVSSLAKAVYEAFDERGLRFHEIAFSTSEESDLELFYLNLTQRAIWEDFKMELIRSYFRNADYATRLDSTRRLFENGEIPIGLRLVEESFKVESPLSQHIIKASYNTDSGITEITETVDALGQRRKPLEMSPSKAVNYILDNHGIDNRIYSRREVKEE